MPGLLANKYLSVALNSSYLYKVPNRLSPHAMKASSTVGSKQSMCYKEVKGLRGHKSRSVGALLGCFCGDALGARHAPMMLCLPLLQFLSVQ